MKALTIRQPWASLVALGVKHIETRSWRAPQSLIGQTIAIHAGKSWAGITDNPTDYEGGWAFVEIDGVYQAGICLRSSDEGTRGQTFLVKGDGLSPLPDVPDEAMPLGAIVATATLADCVPMVDYAEEAWRPNPWNGKHRLWPNVRPGELWRTNPDGGPALDVSDQLPYGDFQPGRWAWLLTDVKPTTERCPACMGTWAPCRVCFTQQGYIGGAGTCPPIPAKGKQGLWEWQP